MTQYSDSTIIMTAQRTFDGVYYIIRVWQTSDGQFEARAYDMETERCVAFDLPTQATPEQAITEAELHLYDLAADGVLNV